MNSNERKGETSTGRAHFYQEPFEFPSGNFKMHRGCHNVVRTLFSSYHINCDIISASMKPGFHIAVRAGGMAVARGDGPIIDSVELASNKKLYAIGPLPLATAMPPALTAIWKPGLTEQAMRATLAPLPPSVAKGLEQPSPYLTTTGTTHDLKHHGPPLLQPFYKKAPGSWKVNYVEDTISTLSVKPWRKLLTMGNQSSEMKDKFKGEPEVTMETRFNESFQPPKLADHHNNGPSKNLVQSSQNSEVAGRIYYPKDRGVLTYHGDMYLTMTQKDHRRFNKSELGEYPKKKYATFWECEEYPKAWGHGSKETPLPRHSVPRSDRPMRDELVFPTPTTIPRLPKSMRPVPNGGLTTEVRSNFTDPPFHKKTQLFQCPVARPLHRRDAGNEEIFSVPKMYETEYQFIGQTRPVIVS